MSDLRPPTAPRLIDPEPAYSSKTQTAFQNQLRQFFNEISAVSQALFGRRGGQYLNQVYAELTADATQTAASADTAYQIAFPGASAANGVLLQGSPATEIVPGAQGLYEFSITLQVDNANVSAQGLSLWLLADSVAVVGSNMELELAPGGTVVQHSLLAAADGLQVFEWTWSTTSTDVSLVATATQTTPTRPATPAARALVRFISTV